MRALRPHRCSQQAQQRRVPVRCMRPKQRCGSPAVQAQEKLQEIDRRTSGAGPSSTRWIRPHARQETGRGDAINWPRSDHEKLGPPGPRVVTSELRLKAGRAGGGLQDLDTWRLKLSQYDHTTQVCTKKPFSQRWHVLGNGSGVVQRDLYLTFPAVQVERGHPFKSGSTGLLGCAIAARSCWMDARSTRECRRKPRAGTGTGIRSQNALPLGKVGFRKCKQCASQRLT